VLVWERPSCLTSVYQIPGLLGYGCWDTLEMAGSLGDVLGMVVVAALDGLSVSILDVDVLLLYGGLVHHLL